MNGREDNMIRHIDRTRPEEKARRARRDQYLRMFVRRGLAGLLSEIEDPTEQAALIGHGLEYFGERLHPITNRVSAATKFNAVAAEICASLRLPRAIRNATAEHAYARLTAANDTKNIDPSEAP